MRRVREIVSTMSTLNWSRSRELTTRGSRNFKMLVKLERATVRTRLMIMMTFALFVGMS